MFVRNFNTNIAASGTLEMSANIQYLCTLVHGRALSQFDSLSADVGTTESLNVEYIIKGLELYFPPVNSFSKQKRVTRRRMKKPRSLKVRQYMARLIDLNEYLDLLPEAIFSDKIGVTESEKYIFNRMPDSWSKNAYVQGFDCESTSFQKAVNLF